MREPDACGSRVVGTIPDDRATTDGTIAMRNLQAQIDGQQWQALQGRLTVVGRAGLIQLITLRGMILGRITDYELAATLAELLVCDAATNGEAFLARAGTRAAFHRFSDALSDLLTAEGLGMHATIVNGERAAIYQAIGRYDEALKLCVEAADCRPGFESLGMLAGLYAERGEIGTAEQLFSESRESYRGVSPLPLARLDFQRGHMWMMQPEIHRARECFEAACRRVPAYAVAQGHLAEVEAAMGEPEAGLARLRPLTISSDDPDYVAQLARILGEVGREEEACEWRALAAVRYDDLVARHPDAFADHAAEFWLMTGTNAHQALLLARRNLELRPTPRAHELFARAARACGDGPAAPTGS